MKWSPQLKSLRRGVRLASGVVKAELERAIPRPPVVIPPSPGQWAVRLPFSPNPGRLGMRLYVPPGEVRPGQPLVVLLHGCGQAASDFAADTGWTALADRLRLPLLLPEQAMGNNQGRCFQWFQPTDVRRDHGEAGSIAAMTDAASERFGSDRSRVFVVGLSAGGAMAAALLAAYPDRFAAGAVVAGLPVGSAVSGMQALARMAHGAPSRTPATLADQARLLGPEGYAGPWPRLSIWHGEADDVVVPANGEVLASQWRALHGLQEVPTQDSATPTGRHRAWGQEIRPALELWSIPGLPHAYPTGTGGPTGPYATDRGPPATALIAKFWGLA